MKSVPHRAVLALLLGCAGAVPTALAAQDLPASFGRPDSDPDFLFEPPRFSIGVRGGVFAHGAGSDLFDFVEERFTVDRCDFLTVDTCAFRSLSLGVEAGLWLGSRVELLAGLDGSQVTLHSEYRDFVEEGESGELAIRQTTKLSEWPTLSLGARWYVEDRGERLGRFVWVPRSWNAFLSGGLGITGYDLRLQGDFVAELVDGLPCETTEVGCLIYTERFDSSGTAFSPFLGVGVEIGISDHAAVMLEGRYLWGSDDLGRDFDTDFVEPLDLSGARLTVGLYYRN